MTPEQEQKIFVTISPDMAQYVGGDVSPLIGHEAVLPGQVQEDIPVITEMDDAVMYIQKYRSLTCGREYIRKVMEPIIRGMSRVLDIRHLSWLGSHALREMLGTYDLRVTKDMFTAVAFTPILHEYKYIMDWLITIVCEHFTKAMQMDFVQFVTGARFLPPNGFAGLVPPLTVDVATSQVMNDGTMSCTADVAGHVLFIPIFPSFLDFKDDIISVIRDSRVFFDEK